MSVISLGMVLEAARAGGRTYRESRGDIGLTNVVTVQTDDGHLVFERIPGGGIVAHRWVSRSRRDEVEPVDALIDVDRGYVQRLAAACVAYYSDPGQFSTYVSAELAAQALERWRRIAATANQA